MLLRFLSVTGALCLSSAVAASLPPKEPSARLHEVNLPYGESSHHPARYLAVNFTVENTTLRANNDTIFPQTFPMEFTAIQNQGHKQKSLRIAYSLETRPILASPDTLGEAYLFKLKFFDMHGDLATDHLVLLTITTDSNGVLTITEVNTTPLPHHIHSMQTNCLDRPKSNPAPQKSWIAQLGGTLRIFKFGTKGCKDIMTGTSVPKYHQKLPRLKPKPRPGPKTHGGNDKGHHHPDPHRTVAPSGRYHHPHYWHGSQQNFSKLVKPIILPAVLGAITGLTACVLGFALGRIIIALYHCCYGRNKKQRRHDVSEILIDDAERKLVIFSGRRKGY
ncbi:hypothetical protein EYZ11_004322 [Aspergillus tanneri]|uniref:Uncharacterized protein n=1 Tax=Aspergillus tanneri TaxID=1220188 RepID=A0A4S3JL61_9EURO|nr:uncharacterized protein ATNIH1004_002277 [Aspergillus tanneri]KAA8649606.1 hypothetical protein ATNIH1004_002277 [Aspergillus tanneri]THC96203.1 hypothetical protein EYZ11_004322 [Aspergillus tanneri]